MNGELDWRKTNKQKIKQKYPTLSPMTDQENKDIPVREGI